MPLESCTSGSALLEKIDELPRGRSSYIATNWLVGHALLWGRMHDELHHDFRSAGRRRARRRNRRRRSLPAALRRGHWRDPPGIARPSGHLFSRPAFDPGNSLSPLAAGLVSCRSTISSSPRRRISTFSRSARSLRRHAISAAAGTPMSVISNGRRLARCFTHTMFASQYLAYDALSDGMKAMLGGMTAIHSAGRIYGVNPARSLAGLPSSMKIRYTEEAQGEIEHPVVRTHVETGRKCLYVNGNFTVRFKD